MNERSLLEIISQGENAAVEFKSSSVRPESLAREMVAFSNTLGGTIVIGVEDDGAVTGVEAQRFEEHVANICRHNVVPAINPVIQMLEVGGLKVCAVEVPKGAHKPYQSLDGKFWIRVGSTNRQATKEELSRLFQSAGLVHFDISPVEGTSASDLDLQKAQLYWKGSYDIDFMKLEQEEQSSILTNSDVLVPHEGNVVATVGGLLIFGKQPQKRLPQSSIMFALFKGRDVTAELIDKKEITGTLPELIDNTAALIRLFLPNPSVIVDLKREEHDPIPRKVIREALVNAVCHRDYSIASRKITAYLFDDRLEITSPGKIANTLTLQKIRYGNSASRNMFIVKYLDNMRYIDGLGRGVPMMLKEMKEDVEFSEIGELFRVTFRIKPYHST